jgi:4-amino-4-deoxy-L-arabinose transferase-like glycosyltransferase
LKFRNIWLISLFIKIALSVWLPLSNDEAYYWVWSKHLQLSYFDHPPMVSWLFWLGQWTDFAGQAIRIPAVILAHCTLLVWYKILRPYLTDEQMKFWLVFVLLSPFLGAGSLIVTPDLPLVFFWSLALLTLQQMLARKTLLSYVIFGAVLGLGFCAKYHMVLFVPIAWIWLAYSGRWREIKFQFLPLAVLAGLVFCFPVWFWNMQNDWVSFKFQLSHGLEGKKWLASYPLEYLLGQIALLFPVVLYFATRRREPRDLKWLHPFVWLPLLFFFYTSFKAHVEANWPVIAYPSALSLAVLNQRNSRAMRYTGLFWGFALLIVLSQIAHPWIPLKPDQLKTSEFTRFDELDRASRELQPFFASTYQMAAALSYKQGRMIYKMQGMNRRDFYDFLPMSMPQTQVFYLGAEPEQDYPAWFHERGCDTKLVNSLGPRLRILEVTCRAQTSNR